jgi:hypothetical protein
MTQLTNWDLYYNLEGEEYVRANLVYTPYISPDQRTLCMSFNRDIAYHKYPEENELWTEELLTDRFNKELEFHKLASTVMPTLKLLDVDTAGRKVFFEWHGDDFLMQGMKANGYENVLFDWQQQWQHRIEEMWSLGIYKISLHPNSWIAHDGQLIPFNWFFCYHKDSASVTLKSLLLQISSGRQEKLAGVSLDTLYTPTQLQTVAFNSFKHNYPTKLMDTMLCHIM